MKNNATEGCEVLLIGYEDEENLGLRSIAAYLIENGVRAKIEPYNNSQNKILERILVEKPRLVGFSLIFQRMLSNFADLIAYLRKNGITAHFTIGGHFPTLEYRITLESIPELDTVVRHEGELTLLELFHNIDNPDNWNMIKGLAYRNNGEIEVTPPRPLIFDLDSLPFPIRNKEVVTYRGLGIHSLLASRGCQYNCSFCSVQQFYRGAPGPKRRSRSPSNVVREMEKLYFENGTRIFLFKDDDLGLRNTGQRQWVEEFIKELKRKNLSDKIAWRVSCRVDEVDAEMMKKLRENGLAFLYLGIESGSSHGLKTFNKGYSVDQIRPALNILQELGIKFEYGFMILDPDSTIESIKENITFLGDLSRDGRAVVHFTKMFPYIGTTIAHRLKIEGRLKGSMASPDYDFNDRRLHLLEHFFFKFAFNSYLTGNGLANQLAMAKFDTVILDRFFSDEFDTRTYSMAVGELILQSNDSVLRTMNRAIKFMENRSYEEIISDWDDLETIVRDSKIIEQNVTEALRRLTINNRKVYT
ncbi:MAG: radical SAM protein [Candidatus Methanoperedens sp.]